MVCVRQKSIKDITLYTTHSFLIHQTFNNSHTEYEQHCLKNMLNVTPNQEKSMKRTQWHIVGKQTYTNVKTCKKYKPTGNLSRVYNNCR